jgi:hypothetical protein
MPFYTVQHRYSARNGEQTFGPWEADETVDLTEAEAEWVNRDSAGCLELAKPEAKSAGREQPPAKDRQHRGGTNRSGR